MMNPENRTRPILADEWDMSIPGYARLGFLVADPDPRVSQSTGITIAYPLNRPDLECYWTVRHPTEDRQTSGTAPDLESGKTLAIAAVKGLSG